MLNRMSNTEWGPGSRYPVSTWNVRAPLRSVTSEWSSIASPCAAFDMVAAATPTDGPSRTRARSSRCTPRLIVQPPPDCSGSSIQAQPDETYRIGAPAIQRNDR
jgi:hypothetical protein